MRFFSARLNFDNGIVLKFDGFVVNLFQYKTAFDTKLIGGDGALGEQASCLLWSSQFQAMQHWESRQDAFSFR